MSSKSCSTVKRSKGRVSRPVVRRKYESSLHETQQLGEEGLLIVSLAAPPEFSMTSSMTAGADEFSDADTHNSHGVYVQPTIKDVLDFCQDVYRKTALFGDAAFVAEFNARVTAIGRVVCAEQGVPFATNNGLSDKTPLGAYAQQLFGELVAWPAEPIDQNTLDEIMSSCDLDDGNDCDDCIDSIDEPMTCRFEFTPINSVDMTDPSFWGPDDVSLDGHWLHRSRHSLPGIGDE